MVLCNSADILRYLWGCHGHKEEAKFLQPTEEALELERFVAAKRQRQEALEDAAESFFGGATLETGELYGYLKTQLLERLGIGVARGTRPSRRSGSRQR